MANVTVHVFHRNDLNGTPVFTINDEDPNFLGIALRPALGELGGGELKLSREVGEDLVNTVLGPEAFVRVIVHAISDTRYVWGWFLTEREHTVLSTEEQAGEVILLRGPGPLHYLDTVGFWHEKFSIAPGSEWEIDADNGVWRMPVNANAGRILSAMFAEDTANTIASTPTPFLPALTRTFDVFDDSSGTPWVEEFGEEAEFRIGDSILTNLWKLQDAVESLDVYFDLGSSGSPKLELNAFDAAIGQDLTGIALGVGVVLWKGGVNILTGLVSNGRSRRKASHILVIGDDGSYAVGERPAWNPNIYTRAITIEHPGISNVASLERRAKRYIRKWDEGDDEIELGIIPGFDEAAGHYFPDLDHTTGHFWLGDSITLKTGSDVSPQPLDYDYTTERVTALRMVLRETSVDTDAISKARSWDVVVELNVERGGASSPAEGQGPGRIGCRCLRLCETEADSSLELETSTSWKVDPDASVPVGWHLAGFDDTAYAAAVAANTGHYAGGAGIGIWSASGTRPSAEENSFRKEFTLTALPVSATLAVSADNGAEVYINGTLLVTHGAEARGGADVNPQNLTFETEVSVDPSEFVVGDNCISIIGWNETDASPQSASVYARLNLATEGILSGSERRAARCDHNHLHNDLLQRDSAEAHPASAVTETNYGDVQAAITALLTGSAGNYLDLWLSHRFLLRAHRGDIGSADSYPENSLEAAIQSWVKGAAVVEVDVRFTSDGVPVLCHESNVSTVTASSGAVSGMTAAAFTALTYDAGFGYDAGRHGSTINLTTFQAVLEAAGQYGGVVEVDLKVQSDANYVALAELAQSLGLERNLSMSITTSGAAAVKAAYPAVTLIVHTVEDADPENDPNVDWAAFPDSDISAANVQARAPLPVMTFMGIGDYGNDETTELQAAWDAGIRLFGTNDLDAAITFAQEQLYGSEAGLSDHLADTTDAHDASAVSAVDAGAYYTGTQVEAILQEIGVSIAALEATAGNIWMPLSTVDPTSGEPELVWDDDDSLIPTQVG